MKIIEKIKQYARNAALTAALGAALLTGCKSSQPTIEDKVNVPEAAQAEKPKSKQFALIDVGAHVGENHTLRTQGFIVPIKGASLGFLLDETTEKALPLDSASSYLQLRPNYDFLQTPYGKLGVIGMAEIGPGFKDRARLGLSFTPKIDGLFTQFRVFPLRSGKPGIRADNFSSKGFLDGILSADLLTNYKKGFRQNGENQLYLEPMIRCDIGKLVNIKELEGLYAGIVGKYGHDFKTNVGKGQLQAQVGYRLKLP